MSPFIALLALLGPPHPIHSSSASLDLPAGGRVLHITLRVFAEDFPPGEARPAIAAYLGKRFQVIDRRHAPMPLQLGRVLQEGAVLVIELTAAAPDGLAGLRIWHGVLAERFADQVNIVQARYAGRAASLLFTGGDGPKALP